MCFNNYQSAIILLTVIEIVTKNVIEKKSNVKSGTML